MDDIELDNIPLRSGQQLSSDIPHAWLEHDNSSGAPPPARGTDLELAQSGSTFLEFDVHHAHQQSTNAAEVAKGPSTSGLGFNLIARAASAAPTPAMYPSASIRAPFDAQAYQGSMPLSTAAAEAADGGLEGGARDAAAAAARGPYHLPSWIVSPANAPMGSVLISIAAAALAVTFFLLILAYGQERKEAPACTLLLTATSAAASASLASLTLVGVKSPATLVCLGKDDHAVMVVQESLATLLVAQPDILADAHAQLSFTSAAGASSSRWAVGFEMEELQYDAARSTATIQVDEWEAAAAADNSTIYMKPEAFETQFGAGAMLGEPLLVLKLDEEQAESLAEAWEHASHGKGGD